MIRLFHFKRARRILSPEEFRLAGRGQKVVGTWLILHACPSSSETKLGLTVSKKFGKAHERNRFKRHMREAFRLAYDSLPPHLLVTIRPRAEAKEASFHDLQKELLLLLKRVMINLER